MRRKKKKGKERDFHDVCLLLEGERGGVGRKKSRYFWWWWERKLGEMRRGKLWEKLKKLEKFLENMN